MGMYTLEMKTIIKKAFMSNHSKYNLIGSISESINEYDDEKRLLLIFNVRPHKIPIFLKKGKIVISVKIRNFSRSRMTKRTSPLKSSREI